MRFGAVIKSMTGFGKAEELTHEYKIAVEIRSVNHRYFDLSVKMPKRFSKFEADIRKLVKEYVQRGKIDLCIVYESYTDTYSKLILNEDILDQYVAHAKHIEEKYGIKNEMHMSSLLRFPEIITVSNSEETAEHIWLQVRDCIVKALEEFVAARSLEGDHLHKDLRDKLENLLKNTQAIEERVPLLMERYHNKLKEKISALLEESNIDESRIITEVAIYADKISIDEELVRLKSHIKAVERELEAGENIGRKVDFISQELNREANTILSKSDDIDISNRAIELKTCIEKIREQVQNIE
jgi:TIGR00255 family protein